MKQTVDEKIVASFNEKFEPGDILITLKGKKIRTNARAFVRDGMSFVTYGIGPLRAVYRIGLYEIDLKKSEALKDAVRVR